MSYLLKRQRRLRLLRAARGHFSALLQPFGDLQTHSSPRHLQKLASYHPDVGQRKQRGELRRVFFQSPVMHLGVSELTLDGPKRMLHLGPHTGLEFLGFSSELAPRRVLLPRALARAHGYVNQPFAQALGGRAQLCMAGQEQVPMEKLRVTSQHQFSVHPSRVP